MAPTRQLLCPPSRAVGPRQHISFLIPSLLREAPGEAGLGEGHRRPLEQVPVGGLG